MNDKRKTIIIAAAVAVILLAALVLVFLISKKNTDDQSTEPIPSSEQGTDLLPDDPTAPTTEPSDEKEPDSATKILDPLDEVGPWIGTKLTPRTDSDGRKWIACESRDEQGSAVMSRTFDPAEDLRGYEHGYLHVQIYIEDLSKMTGGQLELSSSGNPDSKELSWDLLLYLNKSGWNDLYLPFDRANRVGGEIDLSSVNYMRIYAIVSNDVQFGADEIELTNDEPEKPSHLDENGQFVIDEIESIGAWSGTDPRMQSDGAPVGKGYLISDKKDGDAIVLARTLDNLDMSAFKEGYLHIWVYVRDVSSVKGGQIEVSSSGTADINETAWDILNYIKKNGWNELYLPVSKGIKTSGGADFSAINFIRVYILTNGNNALGLDYVCMSRTAPPEPSRIDANNQFVIDSVEDMETWIGSSPYISSRNAAVGDAWLVTKSRDEAGSAVLCRSLLDLDASAYKNGYLHMWLYVEDVSLVQGGQIELSSSGEADKKETSWDLGAIALKNGWNELYLSVADANKVDGGADFSRLNFIRIYVITSRAQTIGVDYIALSRVAPERESAVDENGNYIIDMIEGVSPWSGSAFVYNKNGGYDTGKDWLSSSSSLRMDLQFFRNYARADVTGYREGCLHIWVYIDDLTNLTGGMVEITSTGTVDDGELFWLLSDYVSESGWNELFLPLKSAQSEGDTPADLSSMNCIRVVFMLGDNGGNAGVDEIYFTNTAPEDKKQDEETDNTIFVHKGESLADTWGTNLELSSADAPVGKYWIKTGADTAAVVCANINPAIDIRGYENSGELHAFIYVEHADKVVDGQIELTSSGFSDVDETSWNLSSSILHDGWNELILNFSDANHEGNTNYAIVNYMRVYINYSEPSVIGIDQVYVGGNKTDSVPLDEGTKEAAMAEAAERSVLSEGSDNMKGSIAAVLKKAINGEKITVVAFGASITAGASAVEGMGYADQVTSWLESLDGKTDNKNVNLVNVAIGSTESVLAASRVERDVMPHTPDLVIMGHGGSNDYGLPYAQEAFEGAIRKLIGYGIPIVNFTPCPENGRNIEEDVNQIDLNYGVPQIGFRAAYYEFAHMTGIQGLRKGDVWSSDLIHPTTNGHTLIADLIISYLKKYIIEAGVSPAELITDLSDPVTNNGFNDSILLENNSVDERIAVSMDEGWSADYSARIYQLKTEGWQTDRVGSSLTLNVKAGYFYLFYALTPTSGDLEITVDGEVRDTIDWAYKGTGYMNVYHVLHLGESTEHTIVLTLKDNPNVEKDWFGICAVGASNFDGYKSRLIVHNGESLSGSWGSNLQLIPGEAPEGNNWIRTGETSSAVICANIDPVLDIRGYENSGDLHAWLYISDASKVIDGQIELSSSGLSDKEETAWNLNKTMLHDGWNELTLKFSDAVYSGSTNYALINYFRVYINYSGPAFIGIDEIEVCGTKSDVPQDTSSKEELIAQAVERSVINAGSDNMRSAIASVLSKAKNGESITLVGLGASITAGASATPGQEYMTLLAEWLEGLDNNSENHNVTLKNMGIGSTESTLGVSRIKRDVLAHDPDLVILGHGVNDYGLPHAKEAFEGILCKLISNGIPLININLCPENGNNMQDAHTELDAAYGVPQVSFKTAYYELSHSTTVVGLRSSDIWISDHVHPSTNGHQLIADLLTAYLRKYIIEADIVPGEMSKTLPDSVTSNGFADSVLIENDTDDTHVAVTLGEGWSADYSARIYQLSTEGWQSRTVGSSITFDIKGGYFYMFFALTPESGDLEIKVDGTVTQTINWAYLGTGYMNAHHILHLGNAGDHQVVITLRDNPNAENDWAGICAVGASNFSGYTENPDVPAVSRKLISAVEELNGWDSVNGKAFITGGAAVGNGYVSTVNADNWPSIAWWCPAIDVSAFADEGYLHMWINIPKAEDVVGGQVELTSASAPDTQEIGWNLTSYQLHDGWNELYLPFADAVTVGTPDLKNINFIRIYAGLRTPDIIGIDRMELTMSSGQ
ncbi:MAG: SGNH/GDSL hydrolase family protein [Lachnospiraceae bacterium]|nr:SGNH/GDSL hydrolase family protein [Lachnospiraceae bacterium]